jgi:hypothetical protein
MVRSTRGGALARAARQLAERAVYAVRGALDRAAAARHNRRHRGSAARRILAVRQRDWQTGYNAPFLDWVGRRAPAALALFELRYLPDRRSIELDGCAVLVPWLQDPLAERFPAVYREAAALEARARERGIPVVNPVAALSNAIKSRAAAIIRATGLRTPRMVPLADAASLRAAAAELGGPFFVREDRRHGGPMILVRDSAELDNVPLARFEAPVAVEYIDVRGPDGLYRKRRYLAIGERGVPRHLVVTPGWVVHAEDRILTEATIAEEVAYVSGDDPNHEALQRARRALGLDVVAFDYSIDREGRVVVWEPNPLPVLWARFNERRRAEMAWQLPVMDRVYSALLDHYIERGKCATTREPGPR